MNKLLKEPLLHFILLGIGIFVLYEVMNPDHQSESEKIIIDDNDVERIITNYQKSWSQTPDEKTLKILLDEYIQSEMLYKEALKLNLDHNDEIIKRRLKQKYEFLIEDLIEQDDINEDELKSYYQDNLSSYVSDRKISFEQVYFSPDLHQEPEQLATEQLTRFNLSQVELQGDNSHLQNEYPLSDKSEIARVFGSEFADLTVDLELDKWQGPIKSGFGYHLVRVNSVAPSTTLGYEQVVDQVKTDYRQNSTKDYNKQIVETLREQYEVSYKLSEYKSLVK